MPRPKKTVCDSPEHAMAEGLKALSHPSRIEIVRHLSRRDHCCAGDFCCRMPIAQSTISQHLEILRRSGIVEWKAQGTRSIYTLNRARLGELTAALAALSQERETGAGEAATQTGQKAGE